MVKLPIKEKGYWICPQCYWENPYPNTVLLSYPPQTPYRCGHCDYRYNESHGHPRGLGRKFRQRKPIEEYFKEQ